MDFIERLNNLASKISKNIDVITTEEATKNALIMPFLHHVLGYDVFNPEEVIPEFTADVGTKKGEKVDYALMIDGEVQILIECKKYGEKLSTKHASQLFRYFSVVKARIAILTNGSTYQFYTDLDDQNKMDEKPFLTLDLENIDEHIVPEIKKLTKAAFDIDSIVDAAGELKYLSAIKKTLLEQFENPEEEFVKFFASRAYVGILSPKVKQQFQDITSKALKQFLNERINARLLSAMGGDPKTNPGQDPEEPIEPEDEKSKVVTTQEEIDGFNIVKAILRKNLEIDRIIGRDTQSYFGVLLDDNNRKPLCRLHFNAKQKYLGVFDEAKSETRIPLNSVDDIYEHSEILLDTCNFY